MQSNVDSGLGSIVARREAVDIVEDVVHHEGVLKLAQVYLLQEGGNALYRLSQIGWHAGFAITCNALIFNLYLYVGRGGAGVGGYGEGVGQLQLVREESECHLSAFALAVDVHFLGCYTCQACHGVGVADGEC